MPRLAPSRLKGLASGQDALGRQHDIPKVTYPERRQLYRDWNDREQQLALAFLQDMQARNSRMKAARRGYTEVSASSIRCRNARRIETPSTAPRM